ncbi:ribonuclease inhibitor [Devosia epidermidihirudinis]|uniref:Ribonuclease inhibitor n=1 Tax=Devosia epidermidihirudinis TaxID=1293439 RepID=A0A0F5Q8K6_9HYPH|nr:barstar family protein [Devosia epidermidihirudinis]KKC37265.1 ribonuclease inhibitor [Devosia epidermidihirudinis]
MSKTITIDGGAIDDIGSFYAEINRVFMVGVDWQLGESLDAFNDLLYGGFGAIEGNEAIDLVWTEFERSRDRLGRDVTRRFLSAKLSHPDRFDTARIERDLAALDAGEGQTYFEILLEIIGDHPNITLIAR